MDPVEALQAASPEVRSLALALLDQVSAPLTNRQLTSAFRAQGFGPLEARRLTRSLRRIDIIAVAPRRT